MSRCRYRERSLTASTLSYCQRSSSRRSPCTRHDSTSQPSLSTRTRAVCGETGQAAHTPTHHPHAPPGSSVSLACFHTTGTMRLGATGAAAGPALR